MQMAGMTLGFSFLYNPLANDGMELVTFIDIDRAEWELTFNENS